MILITYVHKWDDFMKFGILCIWNIINVPCVVLLMFMDRGVHLPYIREKPGVFAHEFDKFMNKLQASACLTYDAQNKKGSLHKQKV